MNRPVAEGAAPAQVGQALHEGRLRVDLHPVWAKLIRLCEELGHGEIEKLKIQDGLPVLAEVARKKIKLA